MPRLSRESQDPASHIKHVSGLTTTNVDHSAFMDQVRVLSDMVAKCEDIPFGVFMNDDIFKSLLRNNEVKFRLSPNDTKIGDCGFEHPLIGLSVFAMPDEEKYLGKRDWFVVTKKEYDEYMAKVEEEKEKDHYYNG